MYGRPGEMPQYCSAHKAEDMVDVKKRRRCNADGCERRASYALEGEKAAFCSAHKQAGHVNVNNRRCVVHFREWEEYNATICPFHACHIYLFGGKEGVRGRFFCHPCTHVACAR